MRPPGTYSSRISIPTPLAKSLSSSVLLKTNGKATITSTPRMAPVTEVRPPTTATLTRRIDCAGVK
jgi:hypothetical protein